MDEKIEIEDVKQELKKIFLKNNFVLGFSILALLSILIFLFNTFNVSLGNNFLTQLINLFPGYLWFLLFLAFLLSSIAAYHEKYTLMFLPIILWLLFTTAVVRTSNMPLLKNAATGDWELGPDLDPYLFLRLATEILEGQYNKWDIMRGAPLGIESYASKSLMPWAIVFVWKVINLFGEHSVTYAGIISPVIFFLISILGFFSFVYVLFSFKFSKEHSLTGATIASFFYAFVPSMLHRTVAGIPEIESLGMVWFWFAFLFFVFAWKQESQKKMVIYGLLAGLFTGLMSWTWGGYKYIYLVIVASSFLVFLFEKEKKKNLTIYLSWFAPAIILEFLKNGLGAATSVTDAGFSTGVFVLIIFNFILFGTKLTEKFKLKNLKIPEALITILVLFMGLILLVLIISPSKLIGFFPDLINTFFKPFGGGRFADTVAENRVPYFVESFANFGNIIWLFVIGWIVLFYNAIKHFSKKNKTILMIFFIIFVSSFMFSSISPQHTLNGQNFFSKFLYLGGLILFTVFLIYIYVKAYRIKDEKTLEDFKNIEVSYLILFFLAFFGIMFMRSAIRFFFLVAPALIVLSSYLIIKTNETIKKSKDKAFRWLFSIILAIVLIISIVVAVNYVQTTTASARQTAPSAYNQQWHHTMNWVEQNTPEKAIFAHWWDYGYWVQTLGGRATVADGGYWAGSLTHFLGRYLLTTPNPDTALSLLKSFNASYILIDSSDLGKYSAYSSIGSGATGKDRASWIPILASDRNQIQETKNGEIRVFQGGSYIDKDIVYELNGTRVFLPEGKAAIGGIILEYARSESEILFTQPTGAFFYNNQRYDLPIRYLYYGNRVSDFRTGLNITLRIIPSVVQGQQGVQIDEFGATIYLSEKTMNSLFAELYLMDDPYDKYPTIKLAHSQDDFVVESLKKQGIAIGDFVYFQGFRGPIKIWDTREIPENILVRDEFLQTSEEFYAREVPYGSLDDLDFRR